MKVTLSWFGCLLSLALLSPAFGQIENRQVQMRSVDFETDVLELFNFGPDDIALDGWRFCSHDSNQERVYSSSAGLNGVTIEAGTSFFVHFGNDAPAGDADRINQSTVGNFASPFDSDAFGLQLYFPNSGGTVVFADSTLIADFLQWNIPGQGPGLAEERTAQAVSEGLWTTLGEFIPTSSETIRIELLDAAGGLLHGSADYEVIEPANSRAIQIRSVNFEAGVIEVFNFGDSDVALDGWRFCSHDLDQERIYSSPTGLNGVTIEAQTSIFIRFADDAPAGDPNQLNRSDVGNFALPLDSDVYGIQLFFPNSSGVVAFADSSLIADIVQWNIPGAPEGLAEERTGQAVSEGLWTAVGDFVETSDFSLGLTLLDTTGGLIHGPADYAVTEPVDTRSIQIRSVDFEAGIIGLFNFGSESVDLSGWRFCSHDSDQQRIYTSPTGLNGIVIEPTTWVFVHFEDDAPVGIANRINRADVGNFALPLDPDAYGIQLFSPNAVGVVEFGNSSLIADFVQWNVPGAPAGLSETRTGQAVSEGLWTALGDFVETELDSGRIDLNDLSGGILHSPPSYSVSSQFAFPAFAEDFESLAPGDSVELLGWPVINNSPNAGDYSVTAVDNASGGRSIRIRDEDGADVQNRFYSPTINTTNPLSYEWTFKVTLETLPPGGAAAKPRFTIQHQNGGFQNAFGVELTDAGLDLVVLGIGGDPASASLTGPLAIGAETEFTLSVNFESNTVTAVVNRSDLASLPIDLDGEAETFRFCYRGEGAGNVLTALVDDVAVSALGAEFSRGDCNDDGSYNIADAIRALNILFLGEGPATCEDACDGNDDGLFNVADPVFIIAGLFTGGPPPPPPVSCGSDPTLDALECLDFGSCP